MRSATALPGSLRFRDTRTLVASLLLLVALLLAALVAYSTLREVEENRAAAETDALQYSREAAFGIDAFLSSTNRMLVTLAASPAIRGRQADLAVSTLADLLRSNPEYANIWATGADGWTWANPLPNPDGKPIYVGDRHYFREAIQTGRMSVESIPDNRQHPTRFAVALCVPVLGSDGKPTGTVQAAFEILPVQRVLGNVGLAPGSTITVLDDSANVVARFPSPEQWVGTRADGTQVWQAIQGQTSGALEGEFLGGEKRLVGFTTTSGAPWKVVVGSPPEAAYAGLWERVAPEMALLVVPALAVVYISRRIGSLAVDEARQYGTLFSSIGEGFILLRAAHDSQARPGDYVVLDINPAGERMLGTPRGSLADRPVREALPETEPSWLEIAGQVAGTGAAVTREGYCRDHDRWLQLYAFSPERGIAGVLFADVTERKRAEAERERLLIVEREARAQAEEAVRLRDEFLSIAAHELKTPVTSLRGYAQLLARQLKQNGALDPEQVARATWHLEQQSGRLKRLTEQLLDVARLDSGRLALSPEDTDLAALASGVVDATRQAHPERAVLFTADAGSRALVDGLRLEQVLANLLDNALKYSPKDAPIEVAVGPGEPGWVELVVRDHGDGVPERERGRIFDRFYTAGGERHGGGLGIGLFVSRQIVEMHGGSIEYEDAPGGGSRFTVRLPAARPRLAAEGGRGGG